MTVYVLFVCTEYMGVFSTEEAAEEWCQEYEQVQWRRGDYLIQEEDVQ